MIIVQMIVARFGFEVDAECATHEIGKFTDGLTSGH